MKKTVRFFPCYMLTASRCQQNWSCPYLRIFSSYILCLHSTGKLTQCVFGHWDVVTCLAYSRHVGLIGGDALVVSGSRDATVLVWRWSEKLQRVAATDREEGGC